MNYVRKQTSGCSKEINPEDKLSLNYWLGYYTNISEDIGTKFSEQLEKEKQELKNKGTYLEDGVDYETVEFKYDNQVIDLEVEYCLTHLIELSLKNYVYVLNYMKENNFKGIVDIGVALGWQSDIFIENNLSYTGVSPDISDRYRNYNNGKVEYIEGFYPTVSRVTGFNKGKTLGVAILSLGWGVYVGEDRELIYNQFKRLSKDFDTSLVYIPRNIIPIIKDLFISITHMKGSFYELKS